ncbi:hypothetical protein EYF80_057107 [Liparis tanakae]|uniref:Uncharacterized protein n=1 Tax=Liparis tanakae TaxID=230148 RepID=A0A4Z2EV06_9TELE|nr:hypothetical protein EYF80_057107 [Liparis tanakae]
MHRLSIDDPNSTGDDPVNWVSGTVSGMTSRMAFGNPLGSQNPLPWARPKTPPLRPTFFPPTRSSTGSSMMGCKPLLGRGLIPTSMGTWGDVWTDPRVGLGPPEDPGFFTDPGLGEDLPSNAHSSRGLGDPLLQVPRGEEGRHGRGSGGIHFRGRRFTANPTSLISSAALFTDSWSPPRYFLPIHLIATSQACWWSTPAIRRSPSLVSTMISS